MTYDARKQIVATTAIVRCSTITQLGFRCGLYFANCWDAMDLDLQDPRSIGGRAVPCLWGHVSPEDVTNPGWFPSCDPLAALHGRCTFIIATPQSAWRAEGKDHDGKMLHVCWRSCAPGWSSRQRAAWWRHLKHQWRPDGSREPGLLNAADTKLFWFEMSARALGEIKL